MYGRLLRRSVRRLQATAASIADALTSAESRGAWQVGYPKSAGSAYACPMTDLTTTPWSDPVASVCDVCGKGPGFGNYVSFSHRRTPRRWNPNIQRVHVKVGGTPRRLNVCTSCIKAGKITR
jgi:large subunit ribosomal protein L28